MELKIKKTIPAELELSEANYEKFFARVNLGARSDSCDDEGTLADAISSVFSKDVEREFQENLWLSKLIGTKPRSAIMEKTDLTKPQMGNTLYVNKLAGLKNAGDLGDTHLLESDEENLDHSRVAITPSRRGNAICYTRKVRHSASFSIQQEAKSLLSDWAANKIEDLIIAALDTGTRLLPCGAAATVAGLTATDTILGQDLLRAFAALRTTNAKGIQEIDNKYMVILSPEQYHDLFTDASFVATVAASSQGTTFDWPGFVGNYAGMILFVSNRLPGSQTDESPGVNYHTGFALGARAAALAWEQRWEWRTKVSSYQELFGNGLDAWVSAALLNNDYVVKICSAVSGIGLSTT